MLYVRTLLERQTDSDRQTDIKCLIIFSIHPLSVSHYQEIYQHIYFVHLRLLFQSAAQQGELCSFQGRVVFQSAADDSLG